MLSNMTYTREELDAALLSFVGPIAWRFRDGSDGLDQREALLYCGALLFVNGEKSSLKVEIIRHALGRVLAGQSLQFSTPDSEKTFAHLR